MEYIKQGKLKRAEMLERYRKKFLDEKEINKLIEEDDENLKSIDRINRYYYLGLFEETSVLLNSGIFKADIIHYFFGYYAIRTKNSTNFWFDINQDSDYWKEFIKFVDVMNEYEDKFINKGKNKIKQIS